MGVTVSKETAEIIKNQSNMDILAMAEVYEAKVIPETSKLVQKVTFCFAHDGQELRWTFTSIQARLEPLKVGMFMARSVSQFRIKLLEMDISGEWP